MRRIPLPFLIAVGLAVNVIWSSCGRDHSVEPRDRRVTVEGDEGSARFDWAIGPIPGLTTAWHAAPASLTVPVGTRLLLKCGVGPQSDVVWVNAQEVRRTGDGSIAECSVTQAGPHRVQVVVTTPDMFGTKKRDRAANTSELVRSCVVNGVSASVENMYVRGFAVSVRHPDIPSTPSNWQMMRLFADNPAKLTRVNPDYYRTSVDSELLFDVDIADTRFLDLIEVRVQGQRPCLASDATFSPSKRGRYLVSVGPPATPREFTLETYSVEIASHHRHRDIVPDDTPVTFVARTDPPGYEDEITWLAMTQLGRVAPIVGTGPTFTVAFSGTRGVDPATRLWGQCVGVRADNAVFLQDAFVPPPVISSITPGTVTEDTELTVNGDNFPLDPAAMFLEFVGAGSSTISINEIAVSDVNFDGRGDRIQCTVGPILNTLVGNQLPIKLYLGEGAESANQMFKVFHYDATNVNVVSSQLTSIGSATAGTTTVNGTFTNDPDSLKLDYAAINKWMNDRTYVMTAAIRIVYKKDGNDKHCDFVINKAQFTTDADATKVECAQETKVMLEAAINLPTTPNAEECKDNFEVKRIGGKVVIVKKPDSTADILASAGGHGTTGVKVTYNCTN